MNRLFLNERRHFNNKSSFRFNWQCFGDLSSAFSRFCCKFNRIKIFYLSVNLDNPNSFAFLAFVGTAASLDARMNSFETAMKRDTILTPIPKRRIAKDITSYRSQSNCTKLVSTDLVLFIDRQETGETKQGNQNVVWSKQDITLGQNKSVWFFNWNCGYLWDELLEMDDRLHPEPTDRSEMDHERMPFYMFLSNFLETVAQWRTAPTVHKTVWKSVWLCVDRLSTT